MINQCMPDSDAEHRYKPIGSHRIRFKCGGENNGDCSQNARFKNVFNFRINLFFSLLICYPSVLDPFAIPEEVDGGMNPSFRPTALDWIIPNEESEENLSNFVFINLLKLRS